MYPSEAAIKERNRKISTIVNRKPKRVRDDQKPSPCTVLKGDNCFDLHFTKSGKPTADSQRLMSAMSDQPEEAELEVSQS
jgi:hypothetical protein